jgi:hypothetical protein
MRPPSHYITHSQMNWIKERRVGREEGGDVKVGQDVSR